MKKKLVLGVLCFIFFLGLGFLQGAIPSSERAALIALYNSTDGDNWTQNSGWKTPPLDSDGFALPGMESNWYGIAILNNHVDQISLSNNHLNGSIPTTLENLTNLTQLILLDNQLSGTIPSQLGNLSQLTSLYLEDNQLSGTIPASIGDLSNLEALSISRNQLTGTIPSQLSNLSQLKYFLLESNNLTGSIPSYLGNFSHLLMLTLKSNQLSGTIPSNLGNLSQLTSLGLSSNQLTGTIPASLGNLSQLRYLHLHYNQLSGSLPSQLGNLGNLEELLVSNNQLSGSIPSAIGNLSKLLALWLHRNNFTGFIPSTLTQLSKIILLNIDYNCLIAMDSALITWLNSHNPGWSTHQNQCGGAIVKPTITTQPVTSIQQSSVTCGGNITSGGFTPVTARGVCWGTENFPTINGTKTTDGTGAGTFTSEITGLTASTHYYVRAYATNGYGTSYGACLDFTTANPENAPTVSTGTVSDLTATTASSGGTVTADGGLAVTARGVCWFTSPYPTTSHNKTTDGTGTGSFSSTMTGLSPNTRYYVRAYATNNAGTAYGENISFTTTSDLGEVNPPFGSFDTPIEGAQVSGSIAVTGWALDDGGLASVKIYLLQGSTSTYIGDAIFVEGARPDVAAAYAEYPDKDRAGWGYMLLTHFLPNGGNGDYVLSAIATDRVGRSTELGTKPILVDNAHAVKPFGAIDTPTQGGIASGNSFMNWGWALTPQPNYIPSNGSTIDVWVDGVMLGHPHYNLYRSDIATLFPDYENSNGAVGYFSLNTSPYNDGVHTLQWTVTDSAGNTDGIGSRYFTIQNSPTDNKPQATLLNKKQSNLSAKTLPDPTYTPIYYNKGFHPDRETLESLPDSAGNHQVFVRELERIEIHLGQDLSDLQGYLQIDDQLHQLPIGSTLDRTGGTFYWSPGPGFLGSYSLVFTLTDEQGISSKKLVHITITPQFNKEF